MGRKDKGFVDAAASQGRFHQPFAGLASLKASLPDGGAAPQVSMPEAPDGVPDAALGPSPSRAVLRRTKKGRGGREVTEVSHLDLDPDALSRWLRDLRRELGCGGAVEGALLVLHGDQRERLETWLKARGVRKITLG